MLGADTIFLLQIGLIGFSVLWLLGKNDELPLVIAALVFYISGFRYWSVHHEFANFVVVAEAREFQITFPIALEALNYMFLGEALLLGSYFAFFGAALPVLRPVQADPWLRQLRPRLILLCILIIPVTMFARGHFTALVDKGYSQAFEISSYLGLFPFVLVGLGILLVCAWRCGAFRSASHQFIFYALTATIFLLTFGPQGRFQFVGWLMASGTIIFSTIGGLRKLVALAGVAVGLTALFAVAGALRGIHDYAPGEASLKESAQLRFVTMEDANMLDGFCFLYMAYPRYVEYRWGGEHLEIFIRPIPRAIWKSKPVGGGRYMTRLGFTDPNAGYTIGISPSLFGSFYAEGGLAGILIFSIFYGWMLAKLQAVARYAHPFAAMLMRGMLIASIAPLLRGGDLPGIYSWFGMSYWPCFGILWLWRKTLFARHIQPGAVRSL